VWCEPTEVEDFLMGKCQVVEFQGLWRIVGYQVTVLTHTVTQYLLRNVTNAQTQKEQNILNVKLQSVLCCVKK